MTPEERKEYNRLRMRKWREENREKLRVYNRDKQCERRARMKRQDEN